LQQNNRISQTEVDRRISHHVGSNHKFAIKKYE
jgi:hypothetical protein